MKIKFIFFFSFIFISTFSFAQDEKPTYDQHALFTPNFYPSSVNEYRAADGEPGPNIGPIEQAIKLVQP